MDWGGLARRLREEAHGWTQKELAKAVGLKQPTVSQYLKGTKRPSLESLVAFAKALESSLDYLAGLREDAEDVPHAAEEPAEYGEATYMTVPLLRDRAAAGFPRAVEPNEIITRLPFTRYWLRKRIGVVPREGRLVLIRVDQGWLGESMSPTVAPGSMLLVDRGPRAEGLTEIEDGRIYLLAWEDGLTVKRVYRVDDHLVASPDNRSDEHRPFVVELRGRRMQDVVKGRVIWVANQDV